MSSDDNADQTSFGRYNIFEVFTNYPQYKNANIAICVLAVPFEIYWTTEVSNLEIQYPFPL